MVSSRSASASSLPLILSIEDFKGDFSFDSLFGNLVKELLPSFQDEDADLVEGGTGQDVLHNGHMRVPSDFGKLVQEPLFPEVDALRSLFRDSYNELVDLRRQIDGRLKNLKQEVANEDANHRKTLIEASKLRGTEVTQKKSILERQLFIYHINGEVKKWETSEDVEMFGLIQGFGLRV